MESLLGTSTILGGDRDLAQQLVEWVEDKKFRWQLCYQASRDSWGSLAFHRKCDDVGPTVTLIKCGTNIFGGYTDRSWEPRLPLPPPTPLSPPPPPPPFGRLMRYNGIIYNSYFLT